MPTILHRHIGAMDGDSPDHVIPKGFHRTGRNGIFRGTPGNYRWESVNGTTLIPSNLLPNTGVNMTICAKCDPNKQRLFIFNYNSAGNHGIYIYYTRTVAFVRLIETGFNTSGDPLAFLPHPRISGVDILYGDGNSGDLLFFVDSLKRPRKLNINRLLSGGYVNIEDSFLKVIKAPPIGVPRVTYENDYTVTANNFYNCLWQFAITFIYDDFEESVVSSASIVPLPGVQFLPNQNIPVSQSARIGIFLQTGDQNVAKIRIYGRQQTTGGNSGWLIIDTLIKSQLSINNNTIYKYLFYGNGNYVAADPTFTVLLQDYVPQNVGDQALLDGNVIGYGKCTEGYNYFNPVLAISNSNVPIPAYTVNGTLFFGAPNGVFSGSQPQITFYLTGVGDNDGQGNPTDLYFPPENLYVKAKSGTTDISFSYDNLTNGYGAIGQILGALQAAAIAAGWIYVTSTTNSFTVYYPTGTVSFDTAFLNGYTAITQPYNLDQFAHLPQAAYQYGIVYYDADGRTNGVISNLQGQITTQAYSSSTSALPQILLNLSGFIPPSWAVYYHVVRTDNLTYQKITQWISNAAYSTNLAVEVQQYGYFGITNMNIYNSNIGVAGTAANVVSYAFSPGDRIRITGRYAANGTFTPLNLEYAILNLVVNPITNGVQQTGSFIQINYPAADINANFKLDGTEDFQDYQITLFSYKAQNPTGTNVFYETGLQYGIGNPGTPQAYHMGNVADNQIAVTDGDAFFRSRNVPISSTYSVPTGAYTQGSPYGTIWVNPGGGGTPIVDNGIFAIRGSVNKVAGPTNTEYPTFGDADYDFLNESASPLTVQITGPITVTDTTDPNGQWEMYLKIADPSNNITLYTILPLQTALIPKTPNTYTINATVVMPPGSKMWFVNFAQNEMSISSTVFQVTFIRNITLPIFDYSYNDIYNLRTNADNRPNVIDITALQTTYSTLFRYSEPYQLGTNINNTNRFYPNNFDEFGKQFGDIVRLIVSGREMMVFQYRRCGHVGIYQKFIKNDNGTTNLIVSDTIITPNNIQYFEGEYGIGNQPDGLCSSGFRHYFPDPVKGYWCRLSLNGIEPISEIYKVQTWAGSNLPNYLSNYSYQYGGNAVLLGVFNFCEDRDSEAMLVLQAGTSGSIDLVGETLAFNESKNLMTSFYDFAPDAIVCCENTLYSLSNGQLYSHTNASAPANFYGTQYPCTITIPFNEQMMEKKTFISLEQVANQVWECPNIYTNQMSYGTTPQQSNLVAEDFALLESVFGASFWRDINSQKGQFNGDTLKGNLAVVQFQVTAPGSLVFLSDILLTYIDSRRTNR